MVEIVVVDELAIELPLLLEQRRRRLVEHISGCLVMADVDHGRSSAHDACRRLPSRRFPDSPIGRSMLLSRQGLVKPSPMDEFDEGKNSGGLCMCVDRTRARIVPRRISTQCFSVFYAPSTPLRTATDGPTRE